MDKPCKDKLPFKTKEEAIGAIALAKHRYGSDSHKVYKCRHCKNWHIARA